MKKMLRVGLIVCATGVVACGAVVDSAISTAARGVGTAIGERAGAAMVARMPASWGMDMTHLYVGHVFNLAFHSGGYMPAAAEYAPGEWTRWRMVGEDGDVPASVMERAFLSRDESSNEWWRAAFRGEDGEAFVVEGLFSPGREELLRLRVQTPEDEEMEEVPVRRGTYAYHPPTELTPERIEGATVGRERVSVPAGTFNARHVRFGSPGQETMEWWLDGSVPGETVRYGTRDGWFAELEAYGSDAERELR